MPKIMQRSTRLGWIIGAMASVSLLPMSPVLAQTSDGELSVVSERLLRLERDLQDVQKELYSGQGVTGANNAIVDGEAPAPALEALGRRVDALDAEVRRMTGLIEQFDFRLRQLEAQQPSSSASSGNAPDIPDAGNGTDETGLAPPEGVLGQIPADTELPPEPEYSSYKEQYQVALGYLLQHDYERAEAALKKFVDQHSETELAGPALYWLGETYFARDLFAKAASSYLDGLKRYPDNPKAPDSMLKLGMSLLPLGETGQACAAFKELPAKYPNASETIRQRARVESERAGCK